MSKIPKKILVVDDESDIRELLTYNLSKEGYEVKEASDGYKAVEIATTFVPDLILLDIMMPKQDGVETCRQIKENPQTADSFVIFLTARSEEYSEVAAFEIGANDYISKPIKPRALVSRINALFRRESQKKKESSIIIIRGIEIDRTSYTVKKPDSDKRINLPKKEFEVLFFLAQKPGQVYTRDDLLKNVWGTDVYVLARTVDVHIRKVREKIGDGYISTVKGVGYKFDFD